jgi:hypothetical protein
LKKLVEAPDDVELLFEDEFSLSNTATLGYQWAPKGQHPHVLTKQRGGKDLPVRIV